MRRSKFPIIALGMLSAVAAVFVSLAHSYPAYASTFGLALREGYYSNDYYQDIQDRFYFLDGIPLDYDSPPNSTTADKFINQMHTYLYDLGTPDQIAEYDAARASVVVNVMMGYNTNDPRLGPPSSTRWQTGVAIAKANFDTWAKIVRDYATPGNIYGGTVDFNGFEFSPKGTINGSGEGVAWPTMWDSKTAPRGAAHGDYPEVSFHAMGIDEGKDAIIFTHADGTRFVIKKWCGNLIGDEIPFPQIWKQNPLTNGSLPNGSSISGGSYTKLDFVGTAQNLTAQDSPGGTLTGWMQQDAQAPVSLATGSFGPILAGGTSSPGLPFSYTVPAGTPGGSKFCFWTQVTPYDSSGVSKTSFPNWCYTVQFNNYPMIQGNNGDIHAGGGICNLPYSLLPRNIGGNGNAPSMGQYVVAATGSISSFTSNGTGSDSLKLGANGAYRAACRPNLLQAATDGQATSGGATITPTGAITNFDLSANTGSGKPEVYFFSGNQLNISGTIYSKVTIVALLGSVHVVGDVKIDPSQHPSRSVPSMGVIVQKDIVIEPKVARADGYFFANGTIDTCDPGATAGSTICATPQLLVNGFLMGGNILFNRLGPVGSAGKQVSEKIVLNPQIYLNPPHFFDVITTNALQPQGEEPPLY